MKRGLVAVLAVVALSVPGEGKPDDAAKAALMAAIERLQAAKARESSREYAIRVGPEVREVWSGIPRGERRLPWQSFEFVPSGQWFELGPLPGSDACMVFQGVDSPARPCGEAEEARFKARHKRSGER